MKPKLHQPHGKNHYCGPTAISAVTGISSDDAAAVARMVGGRRSIRGMYNSEMIGSLRALGATVEPLNPEGRPTLKAWMDDVSGLMRGRYLVINVTGHYVAACGQLVTCSLQGRKITHYLSAYCLNKRVKRAWLVTPPAKVKLPESLLEQRKRQQRERAAAASDRAKALRLAKELGLGFERDGDYLYIRVEDTARWMRAMQPAGLLADGEEPIDAIADQCALMGLGWGETLCNLEEIKEQFPV